MYLVRSSLFYQLKLEVVPFLVLLCHPDEQNFYVKLVTSAFLLTFISLVHIFVVLCTYFPWSVLFFFCYAIGFLERIILLCNSESCVLILPFRSLFHHTKLATLGFLVICKDCAGESLNILKCLLSLWVLQSFRGKENRFAQDLTLYPPIEKFLHFLY